MAGPAVKQTLYLFLLDRHHLGDALFLKSLAQHYSKADSAPTSLLVHGSGEKVERTLEAQGYFPERTDGLLEVETEEHRRLVERAVREVNQEIVATMTDEVVSTVGIQGVDRGLLQQQADGTVQASSAGWVTALLKQHIVPVVSALVETPESGAVREIRTAAAVEALARGLEPSFDPVACVFTTAEVPGLPDGKGGAQTEASLEAVSEGVVPEPSAVRHLVEAGMAVTITSPEGVFAGEELTGTRIRK